MNVTEILGAGVFDADDRPVGTVIDLRFILDGAAPNDAALVDARLAALIISPRSRSSMWGYERRDQTAPALMAWYLHRRHRGTFLVHWPDVELLDGRIRLHADARFYEPSIPH